MQRDYDQRPWFWATLMLSCITLAAVVFAAWELVEYRFFRNLDYVTLHYLYITRGIASSLLLSSWAAWFVLRQRRRSETELRRSHERYRGLLEVSPAAMALYDDSLHVKEWNATAEKLYGFTKEETLGQRLRTVPPGREEELRTLIERVRAGEAVIDCDSLRRGKDGVEFEVQLSLLSFREAPGREAFLEVTTDNRERVRLQRRLLEIEKLTSMGKMAAGTAHHLNTPLAALLLRLEMMRDRAPADHDLERLEAGLRFCQHFVKRLLEFSRRPTSDKQPEDVAHALECVLSFLAPQVLARKARISLDLEQARGRAVIADRNQLEALFSILVSNALDAIEDAGSIAIRCLPAPPARTVIEIADDGCGISDSDAAHVFEPFFTTKAPGKGTGLGLAIAQNIVHEHGGSICLANGPVRGTVAHVELPLCCSTEPRPSGSGGQETQSDTLQTEQASHMVLHESGPPLPDSHPATLESACRGPRSRGSVVRHGGG